MRLRRVRIRAYRSIQETSFRIASDVTAIVGANESGKSNVLRAIAAFPPDQKLEEGDAAQPAPSSDAQEEPPTVELTFEDLTDDEKKTAGKVVRDLLVQAASTDVESVSTAIDEKEKEAEAARNRIAELHRDLELLAPVGETAHAELQARGRELAQAQATAENANAQLAAEATPERQKAVSEAAAELQKATQDQSAAADKATGIDAQRAQAAEELQQAEETIGVLGSDLQELKERQELLSLTVEHGEGVAKDVESAGTLTVRRTGNAERRYELVAQQATCELEGGALDAVLAMLPRIVMITSEDLLEESVNLDDLQGDDAEHRAMTSLLRLGGIEDVADLSEVSQRSRRLRRAEQMIAEFVQKRWTQDPTVGIRLDLDGQELRLSFFDGTGVTVPPNRRSPGFLEHVSLHLVLAASRTSEELQNCIVLVDELGIRLHPEGQRDFLAILEDLATDNQVVYTTHSPFMINRNFPDRILLVEKQSDTRTQVNSRPHHERWAPLRSALGLALGDSLLFGDKNVLVEGPADQLILTAFSQALSQQGLETVDLNTTNFVPVGGACSMSAVAKLIEGLEHLDYVMVLDSDDAGYKTEKRLRDQKLDRNKVLLAGDVVGKPRAVTIEDLVPQQLYLDAARKCYQDLGITGWIPDDIDPGEPIVEQLARALDEKELNGLDKVGVAIEVAAAVRKDPSKALGDAPERLPIARLVKAASLLLAKRTRADVKRECKLVDDSVHEKRRKAIGEARQRQVQAKSTKRADDAGDEKEAEAPD